jgi:hypothetical protein
MGRGEGGGCGAEMDVNNGRRAGLLNDFRKQDPHSSIETNSLILLWNLKWSMSSSG